LSDDLAQATRAELFLAEGTSEKAALIANRFGLDYENTRQRRGAELQTDILVLVDL
jgi:hypothetical protein